MMLKEMFVAAALAGLAAAAPAMAADNVMQACGAKYQGAKAAKTLPAGQTWPQFLSACRASLGKTAAAAPAVAAPKAAKVAGQPSAAQLAARSRQKQCAANYQADKAGGKLAGQTWPKYYSACAARLKG